jgi:uncharacterized membrane protein/protein-disulfide isomerase
MSFVSRLLEPKTNGPEAAHLLSKLLGVSISQTTLKKEIEEHPDYPSLLSLSDVLKSYGIDNLGIKFNPQYFSDTPCPFITQIDGRKNELEYFTVVTAIKDNTITFFDPEDHRWSTISVPDFLKQCSGIALLTEAGTDAGEVDFDAKVTAESKKRLFNRTTAYTIPVLVIIACALAFLKSGTAALLPMLFSFLTLCGSIVTILLMWYEVDSHNPVLQQICSATKKVNCSAILKSNAAKIFGLSWSSIGFSYFTGLLILLLFNRISNQQVLFIAAWTNALAVPYIFFSLYYQGKVAKQWCVLCLAVQGLLFLQFVTALLGNWHSLPETGTFSLEILLQTVTSFAIPFICTAVLLPALERAKEGAYFETELQKLKHDPLVFDALLQKQRKIIEPTEGLGLILGSRNPKFTVTKVCNPYCGPCAKAHAPMEALLHNNPDVQLQIIFSASNEDNDKRTPVVNHLLAIAEQGSDSLLSKALDDWYLADQKDYEVFAAKYPLPDQEKKYSAQIDRMQAWCGKTHIRVTPTFFVNGFKLPKNYTVADLKYFLLVD